MNLETFNLLTSNKLLAKYLLYYQYDNLNQNLYLIIDVTDNLFSDDIIFETSDPSHTCAGQKNTIKYLKFESVSRLIKNQELITNPEVFCFHMENKKYFIQDLKIKQLDLAAEYELGLKIDNWSDLTFKFEKCQTETKICRAIHLKNDTTIYYDLIHNNNFDFYRTLAQMEAEI